MKKKISWLLVFAVIIGISSNSYGEMKAIDGYTYKTIYEINSAEDLLKYANRDMVSIYGESDYSYYKMFNVENKPIRKSLLEASIRNRKKVNNKDYFDNLFIVYGSQHGSVLNSQPQYLGETMEGLAYENYMYPWGDWDGTQIQDLWLVAQPWRKEEIREKFVIDENKFSGSNPMFKQLKREIELKNLEANIQKGLDIKYGGLPGSAKGVTNANKDKPIYTAGTKPRIDKWPTERGNWVDTVQVIQPPTYFSWGYGWCFYGPPGLYSYFTVPIAPFILTQGVESSDYSVTTLRLGLEDETNFGSIIDKGKKYTGIVECRIDDYDNKKGDELKPKVEISVNGTNVFNEEVVFTEQNLLDWRQQ